ncbi:MAG TPA: hypothetical protein P5081_09035 [Phycisphaerae bacterium]|nr:hypothetical protein [Phycisphaerae bacterium]HRW53020.1 hypothetical protein [Phycisphaerae bacterium]
MHRRKIRSKLSVAALFLGVVSLLGMECPTGDGGAPFNPPAADVNTAPRIQITAVNTPGGGNEAEQGELVEIEFVGGDDEDRATVRVFASTSANPSAGVQIPILSNFQVGPGSASGTAFWPTNNVNPGSYTIFAEIDDGTFDSAAGTGNRPIMVSALNPILVTPEGVAEENVPPTVSVELPATDAGLTNRDILTIRYTVSDMNSDIDSLSVRFLLDRDRTPSNDATNAPIEIGTASILSGSIPKGQNAIREADIEIDLNEVPIRVETDELGRPLPYFVRVEVSDGVNTAVNSYAVGSVRLLRAPSDIVDLQLIGGRTFGLIIQGFDGDASDPLNGSRVGAGFAAIGDLDGDGLGDFAVTGETASPFNNPRVGEVHVIYGRERRLDPELAELFPFGTGRYAGILSVNTIGSFVAFPPSDPRFNRIFNVRGHTIYMPTSTGGSFGVTDISGVTDFTGDGHSELLVGHPLTAGIFDAEDDDPCDSCTYDEMQRAPLPCLEFEAMQIDDQEIDFGNTMVFGANVWQPLDPATAPAVFANVDFDFTAERIVTFTSFIVTISGTRQDMVSDPFSIDVQIENDQGPSMVVNVGANDFDDAEGAFTVLVQFPVPTLPVGFGDSMPPSIYDGRFGFFVRPTATLDELEATLSVTGIQAAPGDAIPIKTRYNDDFPNPFPNASTEGAGIDPLSLTTLGVVCPPLNRSQSPTTSGDLGNLDGHACNQIGGIVGCQGVGNDNLGGPAAGQSGYLFVNASDDIELTLVTPDTATEEIPAGSWTGNGIRTMLQSRAGQPPAGGHLGARFRGAWSNPTGFHDPLSLYGYTIGVIADIDASGDGDDPYLPTFDLLVSAPGGGAPSALPGVNLTTELGGLYSNDPGDLGAVTEATGQFDLGTEFNSVISVTVTVVGEAENASVLRVGLDGGGAFIPGTVTESLLWGGARPPLEDEGAPQLWAGDILGNVVQFAQQIPLPPNSLQLFADGAGTIRIEILDDCAAEGSKFRLDFVQLDVAGLLQGSGFIVAYQGDNYTDSDLVEQHNCPAIAPTNGDPEGGTGRPNSWPSFHCPDGAVDVRTTCDLGDVNTLFGENQGDSLGFARTAGDLNLDGVPDIACGSPGSDNDPITPNLFCGAEPAPLTNNGKVFFLFGTPSLASGRPCDILERYEIRGSHNDDQFGRVQGSAGDMDGDGNPDTYFAAEGYDALDVDQDGDGQTADDNIGADAGYVGVLFGRQIFINGALSIRPEQIGRLNGSGVNNPGVKFLGGVPGARLGGSTPGNTSFFAAERGQQGVASAGDFNQDGNDDLLITAPGQPWPSAKIEFTGAVADGDQVIVSTGSISTPKVFTFEFDFNNVVSNASAIPVRPATTDALTAQRALADSMLTFSAEQLGISAITSRTEFPAPLPDTPTITFLRRTYTAEPVWVSKTGANIIVTHVIRQGVAYLVFGDPALLTNKTFVLPQDLNRRNINNERVLKGIIFVSAFEKNSGGLDATPDEAPIEAVSLLGDIDGDGFVDIGLGAPQADLINIIAPSERRQSAGEAYILYGNGFGLNDPSAP